MVTMTEKISQEFAGRTRQDGPEFRPTFSRTNGSLIFQSPRRGILKGWLGWVKIHLPMFAYDLERQWWEAPLGETSYAKAVWAAHRLHGKVNWSEGIREWAESQGLETDEWRVTKQERDDALPAYVDRPSRMSMFK